MRAKNEIIWDSEAQSPYLGNMSDFDWTDVAEVRVGYDNFEWVKFIQIVNGYKVRHARTSRGDLETCPEDIWGIRFRSY
jgi:hypothetical protein